MGIVLPSSTAAGWSMGSSAFVCGQRQPQLLLAARAPRVAPPTARPAAFPAIEAKATTKRENRTARHKRIRKKVCSLNLSNAYLLVRVAPFNMVSQFIFYFLSSQ